MKKSDYAEALKLYDVIISLDPKIAYTYYSKGEALYFTAKYADSVKAFIKH